MIVFLDGITATSFRLPRRGLPFVAQVRGAGDEPFVRFFPQPDGNGVYFQEAVLFTLELSQAAALQYDLCRVVFDAHPRVLQVEFQRGKSRASTDDPPHQLVPAGDFDAA